MDTNQRNKDLVWNYWRAMSTEPSAGQLKQFLARDVSWHGFQPLRRLQSREEIWTAFWQPLGSAIPDLSRRPYHFIGGHFNGSDWVCGTGDFIGTFAHDWTIESITIPATRSSVHFRFGEFCQVKGNLITEIRLIIDLPELLRQGGLQLFPPSYGRDLWIPGPLTGDGICLERQDPTATQKTLDLVTEMIFGGLNKYDGRDQASQGLERFWHDNMVWHGPVGIGTAVGLQEFKENAQGPIVNAFPDRRGVGHQARIADGFFAASTGWPSLAGTHQRRFLDWEPTGDRIGWNIMDFWRREGGKLLENWVLIDLIGAAQESQVDLWARLQEILTRRIDYE